MVAGFRCLQVFLKTLSKMINTLLSAACILNESKLIVHLILLAKTGQSGMKHELLLSLVLRLECYSSDNTFIARAVLGWPSLVAVVEGLQLKEIVQYLSFSLLSYIRAADPRPISSSRRN